MLRPVINTCIETAKKALIFEELLNISFCNQLLNIEMPPNFSGGRQAFDAENGLLRNQAAQRVRTGS
jgi:hypothetical protein